MSDVKDRTFNRNPADTELKFFTAITASVTHELNNVLSIINQTGGLLEDLLYGHSQGEEIRPEQLERIAEKLNMQTSRGIDIIKRLNNFAHSSDEEITDFDLYEMVFGIVQLSQRLADMVRAEMNLDQSKSATVIIHNNPLKTEQVVFLILREIFKASIKDDKIEIYTAQENEQATINIIHTSISEPYQPHCEVIEKIVNDLNGQFVYNSTDSAKSYIVKLPALSQGGTE